jgi:hypothetical protein
LELDSEELRFDTLPFRVHRLGRARIRSRWKDCSWSCYTFGSLPLGLESEKVYVMWRLLRRRARTCSFVKLYQKKPSRAQKLVTIILSLNSANYVAKHPPPLHSYNPQSPPTGGSIPSSTNSPNTSRKHSLVSTNPCQPLFRALFMLKSMMPPARLPSAKLKMRSMSMSCSFVAFSSLCLVRSSSYRAKKGPLASISKAVFLHPGGIAHPGFLDLGALRPGGEGEADAVCSRGAETRGGE